MLTPTLRPRILLLAIGLLSLVQFWLIARATDALLAPWQSGPLFEITSSVSAVRLPALIIAFVIYAFVRSLTLPIHYTFAVKRRHLIFLYLATVGISLLFGFFARGWLPRLATSSEWIVFLLTGLIAEELWFRGSIFPLAIRAFPPAMRLVPWLAVAISAALFGLSHLQYYGFRPSAPALAQVAYTFVLGLSLGIARAATGNLFAPILLHLFANLASQMFSA